MDAALETEIYFIVAAKECDNARKDLEEALANLKEAIEDIKAIRDG